MAKKKAKGKHPAKKRFANPYRPGAGHMPPYLAGRRIETEAFEKLLDQDVILENLILTGLRGVGKTVLLDTFKPLAIQAGWLWVGTDLSESTSISEERLALRLLTDLAVATSTLVLAEHEITGAGFRPDRITLSDHLDFNTLLAIYEETPGLVSDKLKQVLEIIWQCLQNDKHRGLIFAYDEAQNLSDHAQRDEYPLSLLLDVFQSLQKKGVRFMLVMAGLPTLFPKLVEARTAAERMFHVVVLDRLDEKDSRDAITKPIEEAKSSIRPTDRSIKLIVQESGGYPYFIQFICREVYDVLQQLNASSQDLNVPMEDITRKLDNDFFQGRWHRATDRQRDLMAVIARLPNADGEFTVQEVVETSQQHLAKPFSSSHVNQMLGSLSNHGLVYKNRYGKYSFAVPLLNRFILRQIEFD